MDQVKSLIENMLIEALTKIFQKELDEQLQTNQGKGPATELAQNFLLKDQVLKLKEKVAKISNDIDEVEKDIDSNTTTFGGVHDKVEEFAP